MDRELIKRNFYALETRKDVADILEIKDQSLRYFLFKKRPENMYRLFVIYKKDGSERPILAPHIELKQIQRKLAKVLSEVYEPKKCVYGFVDKKNAVQNAEQHIKRKQVLNIDLKDFFSQIHFGRVRGMLMKEPYNIGEEAATTIAQLSCCNGRLPQGAPSSPIITNMICAPLDNALMKLAKNTRCVYTRYADDITFSVYRGKLDEKLVYIDEQGVHLGDTLLRILEKHSFAVNPEKISLRSYYDRQEVTGLTVNQFPNVRRSYIKKLRAILHSCEEDGVYTAAKTYIEKGNCKNSAMKDLLKKDGAEDQIIDWFKKVLIGKVNYLKQVKGEKSLTYLSFAKRINDLFENDTFDVSALTSLEDLIGNNIFVLESDENQGSAFYVPDLGLLTSYHVTENGADFNVYRQENYPDKKSGVVGKTLNEKNADSSIDYAQYRFSYSFEGGSFLQIGDSEKLKTGNQVIIAGFPNHLKGNSVYFQTCSITSIKNYMGSLFYTVSGRVVHGMSGGLVLNSDHEVIGIIKGGVVSLSEENDNENQGFVPIHLVLNHMENSNTKEE